VDHPRREASPLICRAPQLDWEVTEIEVPRRIYAIDILSLRRSPKKSEVGSVPEAQAKSDPRVVRVTLAELYPETDDPPEGLNQLEAIWVQATVRQSQDDEIGARDAEFRNALASSLDEAKRSVVESGGTTLTLGPAHRKLREEKARLGLFKGDGFAGVRGSPEEEKFAIRTALSALAAKNPQTLAEAMAVRLSTLYSYSDSARKNRPGKAHLYRAAFMFSLMAKDMNDTAEYLRVVARRAEPSRSGRSNPFEAGVTRTKPKKSKRSRRP
jgi:hypothetical protein